MGKKKLRKQYHSKGQRPNVSADILKFISNSVDYIDQELNKVRAWREGRNPWITVANPNKQETAKKFIRVRANAIYGNYKEARADLFKGGGA